MSTTFADRFGETEVEDLGRGRSFGHDFDGDLAIERRIPKSMSVTSAIRVVGVLACALGFRALAAQTPQPQKPGQQTPTFRTGVDVSRVTVRVLDGNRRPIRGLTDRDFTVLLNGKPQPIVTVISQDEPRPVTPTAPWMRDVAPDVASNDLRDPRLVTIIMDDATPGCRITGAGQIRCQPVAQSKASPYQMEQARKVARAIIDELGPNDLASIGYSADNRGPQDFTADRARLLAAVERYHPTELDPHLVGEYQRNTIQKALEFLRQTPERRSAIFWISDVRPPADENVLPLTVKPAPPTTAGAPMLQAGATTVPFFFVSTVGFTGGPAPRADGLTATWKPTLASKTGGRNIAQTNTPAADVPAVFQELNVVYTIGFEPKELDSDGRFKRIDVRVNRPGAIILPQDIGYFPAKSKETKAALAIASKSPPTSLALSGLVPVTDEPLRLVLAPFAAPAEPGAPVLASVAAVLGLDVPLETRLGDTVDIEFRVFDAEGRKQIDQRRITQALRPRGGRDRGEFDILETFALKPGRYNLRAAMYSQGRERAGSVYTDVTVPDFEQEPVSLSGAVISVLPGQTAIPRDQFRAWLPVVPSTTRALSKADIVSAFLRVYSPADADRPVGVRAEIRDTTDTVVFSRVDTLTLDAAASGAVRSADYQLPLPVSTLAPGDYLLSIAASAAEGTTRRDVRFSVR